MTAEDSPPPGPGGAVPPPRGVAAMSLVRWILVAVAALVAVGAVASHFGGSLSFTGRGQQPGAKTYYCPMHPQIVQDRPGECPICSMTLVPRPAGPVKASVTMQPPVEAGTAAGAGASGGVAKYYCPMHPHVTSNDPNATCDLCGGMKLVPRPASAGSASVPAPEAVPGLVPIDIPVERVQRIGVRTEKVTRRSLVSNVRTVGVVEANERGLAQISPRFSGWIEDLHVSETGQRVRRGQALATIYSPDVLQAQQELLTALGWSGGGHGSAAVVPHQGSGGQFEGLISDARRRLELLGISPQEIDGIVRTRRPLRAIPIRSPVAGHVIGKNAVAGMSVSPGMALFEVADLSKVWVQVEVYESDLKRLRVGQKAHFEASAYPGEPFSGKVRFVSPTVDPASRTLRARLEFPNRTGPDGLQLRPGMYGNVMLDLPPTNGLMVPAEAIVDTGEVQYLFVARDGGHFEPRRVKVGARHQDQAEVLEGVVEGETVVTTANFLIDSESRLRAAIEGRTAKPGSAPGAPGGR